MVKKILLTAVAVVTVVFALSLPFLSFRDSLEFPWVLQIKENLDFIGAFIARYPWLAAVATVFMLLFLFMRKFNLNSTTVKIWGVEFELKQTEDKIKTQVKNYLSTKRSIFVFYDEYDNYYDCINSMYQILQFLRKQLANFDSFSQTNNDSYRHIEGIVREIGKFLTKYQSDYRRYYEMNIEPKKKKDGEKGKKEEHSKPKEFIPFKTIQHQFPRFRTP